MKIGIDISMLAYTGSGVATYTDNLVTGCLKYDKKNEYHLFYSSLRRPVYFDYLKKYKSLGASVYDYSFPASFIRLIWNKFHMFPIDLFMKDLDVFHSSDYLRPPLSDKIHAITTVHDLTWKLFPQYHTKDVLSHHTKKLERTIKLGDTIIVDSKNTMEDLLKCYPEVDKKKVHLIYPGVNNQYKPIKGKKKINSILKKYLNFKFSILNSKFLLYVGAIEPRKNLDTAIKVYARLIKEKKYSDFIFLIIGHAGWKNEHIYKLVKDLKLTDKVLFLGFVPDSDLPYFYNTAMALIYLSLYEGFGLPPLEAGKCHTPSLIYKNSSLAETFPANYPFAKKGKELATLKQLIDKKRAINYSHFDKFTWDKYCKEFLKLLIK